VFQNLERCRRDFYNVLGLGTFLQRLQKISEGCENVSEAIKTFRKPECCQRTFGNISEVLKTIFDRKKDKNVGSV